jgi:UPF0271 protein
MATKGVVTTYGGTEIKFRPDTICMHGDTKEAVDMARAVHKSLVEAGVEIRPLREARK